MGADPTVSSGFKEVRGDVKTFLLTLTDALRPLGDPLAVQEAAAELIAKRLSASRALYIRVRRDDDGFVHIVERDYFNRPDLTSLVGEHHQSAYGAEKYQVLPRGEVMVIDDVHADPELTAEQRKNFEAIECRAFIVVPLIKDGEYIAGLCVLDERPRTWTREEVELVSEVAERTWAAVERARAEAALRESQQLLAAVFDALPMGVVVSNADGEVFLANKGLSRYLPEAQPGTRAPPFGPERWRAWSPAGQSIEPRDFPAARALRGERVVPGIEMLHTQDDGREVWTNITAVPLTDLQGRVTRQVAVITDIDSAKRNAEALARSERRFQQFAQASSHALWMRDAVTLKLEYLSPAALSVFGLAPEDLLGDLENWASLILPEDRDATIEQLRRAARGATCSFIYRIRRASDRKFRWIRGTAFPLLDENGKIHGIAGISEDVTETELAHEHQGVLLSELQHRVRNILGLVRGIAARTGQCADRGEDVADMIVRRIDALSRVQVLLTQEPGVKAEFATIVRDEITAQAPEFARYELKGPPVAMPPKVAESLTLAVHELATNALKHGALGDPPGEVRVQWTTVDRGGVPWLIFDWVESSVRQPAAGETRRRGFGTELIEQRIPYELGGKGRLEVGRDAVRCHLELPLGAHASVLESSSPPLTSVPGGSVDISGTARLNGKKVLVIEDEYYIARDVAAALTSAGAKVVGPCASEATAWAELLNRRPDAAVVDINLGHGPAFKLAEYMRNRDIPFVFLTGYNKPMQPEAFSLVPWLRKPVNFRQLIGSVSRLFD